MFAIGTILIMFCHTCLNFNLAKKLGYGERFHKSIPYIISFINGLLAIHFFRVPFESPMSLYLLYLILLTLECSVLFKNNLTGTLGIVVGSMLHLLTLRGIIVSLVSIVSETAMLELLQNTRVWSYITLGNYTLQLVTLALFILFIPLDTVKRIISNKEFYRNFFTTAVVLLCYLMYNSNIFTLEFYSLNIAVQELTISCVILSFFYAMMFLLIKVFNLGSYKIKSEELEEKASKNQAFAEALLNFAEIIMEVNCKEKKVTRLLMGSKEREVEHLADLNTFMKFQSKEYTHPEDVSIIQGITTEGLIEEFYKGNQELTYEFRSMSLLPAEGSTGVIIKDNEYYWHRMRINLSYSKTLDSVIAVITIDEIQKEKEEQLALRQSAERDSLTGAFNKVAFEKKLNEYLNHGIEGSLFMFDLDNFKGINDNMGHIAGDAVLCEVYQKVNSIFRENDLIGRIGGDEFVAFLHGFSKTESVEMKAKTICERVRKVYRAENGIDIEISCSIGISIAPKHGRDYKSLIQLADLAMYGAKSEGKNTFTIYDSDVLSGYKQQTKDEYTRLRKAQQGIVGEENDRV